MGTVGTLWRLLLLPPHWRSPRALSPCVFLPNFLQLGAHLCSQCRSSLFSNLYLAQILQDLPHLALLCFGHLLGRCRRSTFGAPLMFHSESLASHLIVIVAMVQVAILLSTFVLITHFRSILLGKVCSELFTKVSQFF